MPKRHWGNGLATGLIVGGGLVVLVFVFWYGPECNPDYPCNYPHQNEPQNGSIWYDTAAQWIAAITGVFVVLFTFWTVLLVRQALAADDAALDQAKLQTREAERATEAAIRTADIAGEMGRAQTMAYVGGVVA